MSKPKTIHDFYGFPEKLYLVDYKAHGSKEFAEKIKNMIRDDLVSLDNEWGLDHGTWSVLKNMYPDADIPVVQLSLNYQISAQKAYDIGRELKKLREEGVLIIGSGNIVHNLMVMRDSAEPYPWAKDFDNEIKKLIQKKDYKKLIDYTKLPNIIKAHPTNDHYLPLLYVLGAAGESKASFFTEEIVFGSISMRSVLFEE
jgi:4,5-DOPA dioxygenase extradiol